MYFRKFMQNEIFSAIDYQREFVQEFKLQWY